ncbi:D-alanyl-D-alanine carboxypeptidase [Alkalibacterium sp. AK22]|uniref:M15 family metallopeptidase n=1 Tax=Alkalibacterium sp. AK22 TaxID=1229520 RepID=UPI00044ABF1F|nr:M15 family metallopeptidase [Alkalibacterium sp. AK22]EXJ22951.1 D-alanyl-D-alanine carboxypeptidase [Alkalibacterium sp. AK22]
MKKKVIIQSIGLLASVLLISGCQEASEDPSEDIAEESGQDNSEETPENNSNSDGLNESDSVSDEEDQDETFEDVSVTVDYEADLLKPSSIKALVNKQYALPEDYSPEDLVTVEVPTILENPEVNQLREAASIALSDMFQAAEEEGIKLYARSGYRSYQTQVQLFDSYVSNHGEEAANRYSARPGESEHQTGLAMDVTSESANYQLSEAFGDTEEGMWVAERAHEFGFVIRYPRGKEDVTGYQFEPWHLRYFGEELAQEIYESGLTYEEYLMERGLDIEAGE